MCVIVCALMQRFALTLVLFAVFGIASAQDASFVSRRDGFLLVWQALDRPAEETRELPFPDVPEGERGSLEITYAKRRGLLDSEEFFRPDEALTTGDAVVWLLRTRNVAYPDEITLHMLPEWLNRYPLITVEDVPQTLTVEVLVAMMQRFDTMLKEEVHEVSLYAEYFHGKGTAFGESFDMNALTAAHRTFPYNTLVKVTNIENDKSVIVRINDRGPFVEGRDMDLSLGAFTTIADRSKGVIHARFERLGTASGSEAIQEEETVQDILTFPTCSEPTSLLQRIGGGVALYRGIPNVHPLSESFRLSSSRAFVVRSVIGPDGLIVAGQDFILPGEVFEVFPGSEGTYTFVLGGLHRRVRRIPVRVEQCAKAE